MNQKWNQLVLGGEARKHVTVSIAWQGKPISCNKSFGKLNCSLCMKERLEILRISKNDPAMIINSSAEFYGAYRHKPRFHRYLTNCTPHSTDDERRSSERVNTRDSINSQNSLGTISTEFSSENDLNLCRPCTTTESQHTGEVKYFGSWSKHEFCRCVDYLSKIITHSLLYSTNLSSLPHQVGPSA